MQKILPKLDYLKFGVQIFNEINPIENSATFKTSEHLKVNKVQSI